MSLDNGDTANKIGTYNLAVSCKYHSRACAWLILLATS
jgi:methylthioribose-1-phosphate isomerase